MAINGRFQQKHDYEANWLKATSFTPMKGEIIVYLAEANINGVLFTDAVLPAGRTTPYTYSREKVGDGVSNVNDLPFANESVIVDSTRVTHGEDILSAILDTYLLNIDYETLLAFDTSEIVIGAVSTTSVLGQAILGQMVLA